MAVIAAEVLAATGLVATYHQARSVRDPADATLSLQQLNRAFLSLTTQCVDVGLPTTTRQLLRQLSDDALFRLSCCPYALFELPLAGASMPAPDEQRRCATAALFYAWHIAQSAPTRAQLWFSLDAPQAMRLRSLAAVELSALVDANSGAFRARLGEQACYWPAMIRAAESGDVAQLRMAQLLGRQILS